MSEKTEPKLVRADQTPEGKEYWRMIDRVAALAPKLETEPCKGIETGERTRRGGVVLRPKSHCPGYTSATEQIAELEHQCAIWQKMWIERPQVDLDNELRRAKMTVSHLREHQALKDDLASMRTLAGELLGRLKEYNDLSECYGGPDDEAEALLAKAKKMGVGDGR